METQNKEREASTEIPLFTILKNSKTGEEYKVCNFDHPDICPRTGIIEIETMKKPEMDPNGQTRADYNATVRASKDPNTEIIYGIPIGFHPISGEPRWMPIVLSNQTYFDRTIPDQVRKAAVAMHDFRMEGSPTLNQKPIFKVRDKDRQAQEKIEKFMAADEARMLAKTLVPGSEELIDFALVLGKQVHSYSPIMLYAEVLEEANRNPVMFNKLFNDPDRKVLTILKKAVEQNVVKEDPQLGYQFNGLTLGNNEANAVYYLKTKPDIQQSIAIYTASKKLETEKSNAKKLEKSFNPVKELVKESTETDELKKELAEMKKQMAELIRSTKDVPKEPKETKQTLADKDAEELAVLQSRAEELKITTRNATGIKNNPEKLAKLIALAEKELQEEEK